MDLPIISEKKNTFRKSASSYLEFLARLNLHIRDIIASQNFLKNVSILWLERSDLIPNLENELGNIHPVSPEVLKSLFELVVSYVECVILNACYSETQAKAIAEHIDYVVGMSQAIGDKAATAFSVGFYRAVGAGRTIEDAFNFGVVELGLLNIAEQLTPVIIKKRKSIIEEDDKSKEVQECIRSCGTFKKLISNYKAKNEGEWHFLSEYSQPKAVIHSRNSQKNFDLCDKKKGRSTLSAI